MNAEDIHVHLHFCTYSTIFSEDSEKQVAVVKRLNTQGSPNHGTNTTCIPTVYRTMCRL